MKTLFCLPLLHLPLSHTAVAQEKPLCVGASRGSAYNARPVSLHEVLARNSTGDMRGVRLGTTCIHVDRAANVVIAFLTQCIGKGDEVAVSIPGGPREMLPGQQRVARLPEDYARREYKYSGLSQRPVAGDGVPDRQHDDGADHRHQDRDDEAVIVIVEARASARNSKPPTSAPTRPSAILTMQPPPRLPMIWLASQPVKAPKMIQPRYEHAFRSRPLYFRLTYIMVIAAAAITAVDSQPNPPSTGPARNSPILRLRGHEHHRRHHRHGDDAVQHRAPVQRLDGIDAATIDAQSQQHRRADHRIKAAGLPGHVVEAGLPARASPTA